jgi:hypothetical protein
MSSRRLISGHSLDKKILSNKINFLLNSVVSTVNDHCDESFGSVWFSFNTLLNTLDFRSCYPSDKDILYDNGLSYTSRQILNLERQIL